MYTREMFRPLSVLFKFALVSLAASGSTTDQSINATPKNNITSALPTTKLQGRAGETTDLRPRAASIEIAAFSPPQYGSAADYGDQPSSYAPPYSSHQDEHQYTPKAIYGQPHSSSLAQRLHDHCYNDLDCRNIHYSACRGHKCRCAETLFVESLAGLQCLRRSRLGVPCEQNNQCDSLVENSLCVGGLCRCAVGFIPFGSLECVPAAKYLHDPCIVQDQCAALGVGVLCYAGRCECDPTYFVASSGPPAGGAGPFSGYPGWSPQPAGALPACLYKRKLGETCLTVEQCAFRVWNSTCNNGICTCVPNAVPIGNEQCAAVSPTLGSPCTVDLQCTGISPDAVCKQGVCQCSEDTVQQSGSDTTCLLADAALNDPCVETAQCAANNSACINNVCTCDDGFSQFDTADLCLEDAPSIGDPCTVTSQCAVPNTFCDPVTQTCICTNNFSPDATGTNCVPGGALIGSPCTGNAQCARGSPPPGVGTLPTCIGGICGCATGTVADLLLNVCLPQCLNVGGPCVSTVQCQHINKYNVFICAYDPVVYATVCAIVP